MKKILLFAIIVFGCISCGTSTSLYDWKGYDDAVYKYINNADEKSVESLMKVYERLNKTSGGTRQVPPPGVCADYGYLLLKNGKIKEGKELLKKEISLYPESKQFIDRILDRLEE